MDKRVAVAAGAWYQSTAVDRSRLMIYAVPMPGITLDQLGREVDAVVKKFSVEGVSDAELNRAKTRLVADAVYAQDSQSMLARMYGSALATGSSITDVQEWPHHVEAVTAEQVREAIHEWLGAPGAVTGYLLKEEAA
jgi:zinc protease